MTKKQSKLSPLVYAPSTGTLDKKQRDLMRMGTIWIFEGITNQDGEISDSDLLKLLQYRIRYPYNTKDDFKQAALFYLRCRYLGIKDFLSISVFYSCDAFRAAWSDGTVIIGYYASEDNGEFYKATQNKLGGYNVKAFDTFEDAYKCAYLYHAQDKIENPFL